MVSRPAPFAPRDRLCVTGLSSRRRDLITVQLVIEDGLMMQKALAE